MIEQVTKPVCGVVMPISSIDGCSEEHWRDVFDILVSAIDDAGFEANLVSNADEVGIIHKRIIQNLYDNPIVVCDVSGKNPNVMFELGVRLAFDKPTIVIKDDKTPYSFDSAPIEHISYPRDLRYSHITDFKKTLAEKIRATHLRATTDEGYTTFLKHFGEFKVAKINKKEVSGQEYVLAELKSIRLAIERIQFDSRRKALPMPSSREVCLKGATAELARDLSSKISQITGIKLTKLRLIETDHFHLKYELETNADRNSIFHEVRSEVRQHKNTTDKCDTY